ncbi:MAG: nuclear transport factor 2 family protein [Sphingomonas sp.]
MTDEIESFSALLRVALGDRIAADATSFLDMLADDAVMDFPYAPPGMTTRLDGKAAIARHLQDLGGQIAFDRMGQPTVFATTDPDVTLVEFDGFGRGVSTGEPYDQRYLSIIRTRDGRIVHYRDYWNPLVILRALRGAAIVDALAGEAADHG